MKISVSPPAPEIHSKLQPNQKFVKFVQINAFFVNRTQIAFFATMVTSSIITMIIVINVSIPSHQTILIITTEFGADVISFVKTVSEEIMTSACLVNKIIFFTKQIVYKHAL